MLKSTHKPSAAAAPPLPPGWTEHKAPTGHTYYHNATTGESTYTRPGSAVASSPPAAPPPTNQPGSFLPYPGVPSLADPAVANAFLAQYHAAQNRGKPAPERAQQQNARPVPQPHDKPVSRAAIPGCEGWFLVGTKYGRRFAYNAAKNASYWRIPEKLKAGIVELDQARIRAKATGVEGEGGEKRKEEEKAAQREEGDGEGEEEEAEEEEDNDEYEEVEVEVTDDEGEDEDEDEGRDAAEAGPATKRQRITGADVDESEPYAKADTQPMEFDEADIAYQLQAMNTAYGLDDGGYGEGAGEGEWDEGAEEEEPLSEEDARSLFKDMLEDLRPSPYSPWDRLVEEGKMFDDTRYTVLNTMKARREAWDEWSAEKIRQLKEKRAKEEKKDPRIAYMAFLQEKATPKLYWAEFKRKHKKEAPMKDAALGDKDREKLYREHINRLKLPVATLKSDLTALLRSQPAASLNNQSLASALGPQIITDPRYISLDPKVRDPLIEAFISTLPPPPEGDDGGAEAEQQRKERERRGRARQALEQRRREVELGKKDEEKKVGFERLRLQAEERGLERATREVGRAGLRAQLEAAGRKMDVDL